VAGVVTCSLRDVRSPLRTVVIPARPLADAELRIRRQHQVGVDEDVTLVLKLVVRVANEFHMPARAGVLERCAVCLGQAELAAKPRRAIEPLQLLIEGTRRLRPGAAG
jgi:hypothetical protein